MSDSEPISRTLTRDEFVLRLETVLEHGLVDHEDYEAHLAILAHDAALRARIVELENIACSINLERDHYRSCYQQVCEPSALWQMNAWQAKRIMELEQERDGWHDDASSHLRALTEKQAEMNGLEQQLAAAQAEIARLKADQ